ncbi:MAG: Lrp/AsnC family transcriptional regulator [Anaerolineales bacterium]|nr:Lrp/AsnC family transcriptional regulator [Chloroflexota bacterium]MBL6979577.1 Lrp/AsnC family transcriptional regulator [Anaerolineales bacterium]
MTNSILDDLDKLILAELQADARISNTELARRVNLSPPATHARVRRLEESGLADRYVTLVNKKQAGYDMLCFVRVRLQLHDTEQVEGFHKAVHEIPEVLECHFVTGDHDYLLKVLARNSEDLEDFLVNRLTPIPGVAQIHTSLVLREVKNSTIIPLK